MANNKVIWQGTVDNMGLAGIANGDKQPMRIVEDADGRLMTEFASSTEEAGGIEYDESQWIADYQASFRDMQPAISEELKARMIENGLLEAIRQ